MVLLLQVFCCSSLSTCVLVDQIGKILVFWPKAISWTCSASTICVHSPTVKLVGVIDNHAIVVACFVAWTISGGVSSCAFQGNVKWLDHINCVREILVRLNHLFTLLDHNFFLTYLSKFVQTHRPSTNTCNSSRSLRTSLVRRRLTLWEILGRNFWMRRNPFFKTFCQYLLRLIRDFQQGELSCWTWRISPYSLGCWLP